MTYSDENVALCALNRIFGYHPRLALDLLEQAGSAAALFSGDYLRQRRPADTQTPLFVSGTPENVRPGTQTPFSVSGHPELMARLVPAELDWAAQELERIQAGGFRFIGLLDKDYPSVLRECSDPPLGIYLNGSSSPAEIFGLRPCIAIVGTRDLSPYGKEWCRKLVRALAQAHTPPCIVSGLAFGADGIAHREALSCGLTTLGVMATGIDKVYPWQHTDLAMEMVRTPGCGLITDYPTGTSPVALNFLRRNRIIAGLAQAVIVVESKSKGGSLMTAKYAVDYGRDVYALPGRIDDVRSAGCNSLIASQMAQLITSPEELVALLGLGAPARGAGGSWLTPAGNRTAGGETAGGRMVGGEMAGNRTAGNRTAGGGTASEGDGRASPRDAFRLALERAFGNGSAAVAIGLTVRENRGIILEDLCAVLHLPIATVLECAGRLEADGFITTDLFRRCAVAPDYA